MKQRFGKKDISNALVTGFALFAAFFGAGNLIFPPLLGAASGKHWLSGFLAFLIADAGVAVLAVLAVTKKGGGLENQLGKLWKGPVRVLCIIMSLIMGPLVVIPRTCATAYEMSIKPLLPGLDPWIFSLIFFAAAALLTIRPARVVDIIGKYLTPILLAALIGLCLKGIITPLGPLEESSVRGLEVRTGITFGYQTMDALLAIPLSVIVIKSVKDKGYEGRKKQAGMISLSCLVAFAGLLVVYAGLSYLGATVSSLYVDGLDGTVLVVEITARLMERIGTMVLGVIVLLACLTTAIGVSSAIADYFVGILKNRISYEAMVIIFCVSGVLLSNLGTRNIIAMAEPVLMLLYPVFLTQIFLNLVFDRVENPWVFRGPVIGSLLYLILDLLDNYGLVKIPFLAAVPLSDLGLGWVLPAIAGGLIGLLIRPGNAAEAEPKQKEEA